MFCVHIIIILLYFGYLFYVAINKQGFFFLSFFLYNL